MTLNFPANPDDEDVYEGFVYDESKGTWKLQAIPANFLNDLSDVEIDTPLDGQALIYSGTGWANYPVVDVSENSPTTPPEGQLWFNSSDLSLYVYYNNAWVAV